MTTLVLTRHGHVDWIAPERFRGRAELSLSATGERQIVALGDRIARSWQPAAIYSSPRSRCQRTAEAIAKTTQASVETMPDLDDIDYGEWQGLTHPEVEQRWPKEFEEWMKVPHLAEIPGGETLATVLARTTHALHEILHKHPEETVVLVGHDSVNRVMLMHCLGLPLSSYWRLKQEPCAVSEVKVANDVFTIHRVNEAYHLIDVK